MKCELAAPNAPIGKGGAVTLHFMDVLMSLMIWISIKEHMQDIYTNI